MKIHLVALGMILASTVALAQDPPHGSPDASAKQPFVVRMKNELGLTDEQVEKMRAIREGGGTREEMQAVLTPEQRAKAAQLRHSQKGDRAARQARVQQELGISDEQMEKMNAIKRNGGTLEEMRAVLTPEQQAKFDALRSKRSVHAPAPQKPAATPAVPAAPATPAAKPATTPAS